MTAPLPPLTDEQFEATTAFLVDIDFLDDEQHKGAVGAFIADASSCRAELAQARAENERLRTIMDDVLKQFDDLHERLHDPDNTFEGFSVAVNACVGRIKEALAPEKEGG